MLKQEYRPDVKEEQAVECHHHWIIEPTSGPISYGKCRICGAKKEFKNYLDEAPWSEWTSPTKGGVNDLLASFSIPDDDGMD